MAIRTPWDDNTDWYNQHPGMTGGGGNYVMPDTTAPADPTTPPPVVGPTPPPQPPPPVDPGGGGGGGYAVDPSYLAPWTGIFDPGARAQIPDYQAPAPFSYADWSAPDPRTIMNDPSYQWRLNQGSGALENSAAAKGVLNTGGTLKDLIDYGQNFASNEYSNVFNRGLDTYRTNRNNAADVYATNYGVGRDTYNTRANNANTEWQRAWNDYQDREKSFYANQDRPFQKLSGLVGVGANAASA